jgi:DNA repair exonuclease SbcCD ATPase subunit
VAGFRETLREAVRQLSFRTSVDSLKKRGVQQVSVLGLDRIAALIEAAVHRSLKAQLVGVERAAVADATKAEFLRLLRTNEDLQRQKTASEQLRERAEEELDHLRRELQQQQQALQQRLAPDEVAHASRYEQQDAAIAAKIAEVARSLGATGEGAEQRLVELVMDVVSGERRVAEVAQAAVRDREVDQLQRRIRKLTENLGATEQRLHQLAAGGGIDPGISSVYRTVQGLAADAAQAERKRELMAVIFRANLELQKKDRGTA